MVLATHRYGDPISSDGFRIDNEDGNKEDKSKNWTNAVNAAKSKVGASLPPNAQFVIVEKGDCLWRIAQQYGEDPEQLIADNRALFSNPNLIFKDQVVIVRGSSGNASAWTPAGNAAGGSQPAATGTQPLTTNTQT